LRDWSSRDGDGCSHTPPHSPPPALPIPPLPPSTSGGDEDDDQAAFLGAQADGLLHQAALPAMRDPKLWMVGCKEGEEPGVLIALCNKCIARGGDGENLGIMSAVCTSKGCVGRQRLR
jgi:hypothetical protein